MNADANELGLTARNASVEDLVALLRGQQARKVDVVASASSIRAEGGYLVLDGTVPVLGEDGVTMTAGRFRTTDVCDAGIAEKLGIPAGYLRRMRAERPGLFDANVNGWLAGDDRSFLVRCLRGGEAEAGVARAWLSDGYKRIDHLDTLMAVFDGIRQSGQDVTIDSCDLTERRMYVRVRCEVELSSSTAARSEAGGMTLQSLQRIGEDPGCAAGPGLAVTTVAIRAASGHSPDLMLLRATPRISGVTRGSLRSAAGPGAVPQGRGQVTGVELCEQ